jgi:cytochrome c biogenesis protein CcdA
VTLLVLFAFVAGAGTAISPCVLPVLPALLSAGATGGRRRPLAIVIGLATTFAITVAGFAKVVDGVGLGQRALRTLAVLVLAGFGVALLAPRLADRVEAPLSRLARFGPKSGGDGFWSGLVSGRRSASSTRRARADPRRRHLGGAASGESVRVAVAYALGSAVVLFALSLWVAAACCRGRPAASAAGVVMIATALAVATDADVRFQTALADHFPSALVNPTGLDRALARGLRAAREAARHRRFAEAATMGSKLPVLGKAPDFTGNAALVQLEAADAQAAARGRVVLVDFWTYTCINCIARSLHPRLGRALPLARADDRRVHTPEFQFEHDAANVQDAIAQNRLRYPVARTTTTRPGTPGATSTGREVPDRRQGPRPLRPLRRGRRQEDRGRDPQPARRGGRRVAGRRRQGRADAQARQGGDARDVPRLARAQGWVPNQPSNGLHDYTGAGRPLLRSRFAFTGRWKVTDEAADRAGGGASIDATWSGKAVYLVLSSAGDRPRALRVELDGKPLRTVTVRRQRLYTLVSLPKTEEHTLTLRFAPGLSGYAFTFG